jgi:hypothetical protein
MSELFHMVSGTSTDSLLTTAIVLPNNDTATNSTRKNMFFAVNATNIYKDGGKDVFRTFTLPLWVRILGTLVLTAIGGGSDTALVGASSTTPSTRKPWLLSIHTLKKSRTR